MPQISLLKCAVWSELLLVAWTFHKCYATDWTSFGVSWLKWRLHRLVWVYSCKMPHCWKSHVTAHSVGSLSFWRIRFYRLFTWKYFILSSGKLQDKKTSKEKYTFYLGFRPCSYREEDDLSRDMWFPTLCHFVKCRLRWARAAYF